MYSGTFNRYSIWFGCIGLVVGLTYYNWFASPEHYPLWIHALIMFAGYVVSVLVAAILSVMATQITWKMTGSEEGSPALYVIATLISPVVMFFVAKYALVLLAA